METEVTAKGLVEGQGLLNPVEITAGRFQKLEMEVAKTVRQKVKREFDEVVQRETSRVLSRARIVRPEDISTHPVQLGKFLEGILRGVEPEKAYLGKGSVRQKYEELDLGVSLESIGYDFTWEVGMGRRNNDIDFDFRFPNHCLGNFCQIVKGGMVEELGWESGRDGLYRMTHSSASPLASGDSWKKFEVLLPLTKYEGGGVIQFRAFPEFLKQDTKSEDFRLWWARLKKMGYEFKFNHLDFSTLRYSTAGSPLGDVEHPRAWSYKQIDNFPEELDDQKPTGRDSAREFRRGSIYLFPGSTAAGEHAEGHRGLLMYAGWVSPGYDCFLTLSKYPNRGAYHVEFIEFEGEGDRSNLIEVIMPELGNSD
ncbi:MAG: hypothetical protein KJ600_04990 [Nanoarchaeota archaeon]|nr:hypothetical protein [Nanoarchaeota archaeon]MBU1103886.1 hypothetical protein [Nanoarchaeota archaeon]